MKRKNVLTVLNCATYSFISLEVLGCVLQFIDQSLVGPCFVILMFCLGILSMFVEAILSFVWKFKDLRENFKNNYDTFVDDTYTYFDESDGVVEAFTNKTDEKEIHFYKDYPYSHDIFMLYTTHNGTKWAINNNVREIHTTSLSNISFDLLDQNYRIYLHENNRVLECKPGMDGTEKDIRKAHNIFKIIVAGVFDNYFYSKNETDEYVDDQRCVESEQESRENNNDTNE